MSVFKDYAAFYDALYADKDYGAECDYVFSLWQKYGALPVKTVLDLGCGTGGHALLLAKRGYEVVGIDQAEGMLKQARSKGASRSITVQFTEDDIRSFRHDLRFDAVIAMFSVMSYLTTNEELLLALRCVRNHLKPQGLFIFDVWFGPAVLKQRPEVRRKTISYDGEKIHRIARPRLNLLDQTVRVDYLLTAEGKDWETRESHLMRFFFYQEIKLLAQLSGMELVAVHSFLSMDEAPTAQSWNVSCIYRVP